MRRRELDPLNDGEPDLEAYPQTLLLVHRRYEIRPGGSPEKARFDLETAKTHLESLLSSHLASAPTDVSEYIASILRRRET